MNMDEESGNACSVTDLTVLANNSKHGTPQLSTLSENQDGQSNDTSHKNCNSPNSIDPELKNVEESHVDDVSDTKSDDKTASDTSDNVCKENEEGEKIDEDDERQEGDHDGDRASESSECQEKQTRAVADTFAYISEQLNFLNTESGILTTHIHKSDEHADENKEKHGVKRRLDKESTSKFKKDKRQKLDNEKCKEAPTVDSDDQWMDVNTSEDSSSEDGWRIIEESESELDKKLEDNAKKNHLSAANVKTILHQVITNEHVIAMVKSTLNEELSKQEEALSAQRFEPKMTRSKVKQVLEKEGAVPHPWPLSPLKRVKSPPPTFLDITFSEEEDDDEYEPTKDMERIESDEDSESVVSSQVYSPCPSTPTTPRSCQLSDVDKTSGDSSDTFHSPVMGPPTKPFTPKQKSIGTKFQKMMAAEESTHSSEECDDQIIALRTRSRLPLTETSLSEIESNFVIPDITPDMYETECNDEEWQTFLTELTTEKATVDMADDEASDPEYNYLEEADNEEVDEEDFRRDRAVRVSKKELNELMDELFEAYGELDALDEADKELIKAKAYDSALSTPKSSIVDSSRMLVLPQLLPDQRRQLDDQMRKHVQLLTQTYILSQTSKDYNGVSSISKHLLNELHRFSNVISSVPDSTAYRACNLEEAVNIVNEERDWTLKSPDLSPSLKPLTMTQIRKSGFDSIPLKTTYIFPSHLLPLSATQKDVIWTSRVFMFPELVPRAGFLRSSELKKEKRRIVFTKHEDNLIVLGLEQFKHLPKHLKWIKQLLMPCKTPEQIRIRIKNLATTKAPDNPIKYYKKHKKVPDFPHLPVEFNENDIMAPREQNNCILPIWCRDFEERIKALEEEIECSARISDRRRASSITLPVLSDPPTPSSLNTDEYSAWSAPVSPAAQIGTFSNVPNADLSPITQKKLKFLLKNPSRKKKRLQQLPIQINQFKGFLHLGVNEVSHEDDGQPASPITVKVLSKEDCGHGQPQTAQDKLLDEETDQQRIKDPVTKEGGICSQPVTCVLPTFIVMEPTISCTVTMTSSFSTSTSGTGMPIMSTSRVSQHASQIPESSSILPLELDPDSGTYTPVLISPYKTVTTTQMAVTPQQKILETTPTKFPPGISQYIPLSPKALSFSPAKISKFSPLKPFSPSKKLKESPRRQYLQAKSKQARNLLSKGFVLNSRISPVKIAAYSLRNKARRHMYSKNPVKILPKPAAPIDQLRLPTPLTHISENAENKDSEKGLAQRSVVLRKYVTTSDVDDDLENEGQPCKGERVKKKQSRTKKSCSDVLRAESDDTQSETDDMGLSQYDSQNEEEVLDGQDKDEHLATLMAASTTIGFTSKKNLCKDKGVKAKKRKELTLSMLAPDLVQSDPYRDERDTMLAQDYLTRVKNATKQDLDTYEHFLKVLYEFGKGGQTPVKLYQDILVTLENYPELAEDFSGFLLPEQALECSCFMSNLNFIKARAFLRKIEIYFDRHPNHFQKVMRIFTKWSSKLERTAKELRDLLEPMLKGQPHLLEELSSFFAEERPPESYMTDFEEVTLGDSDEESRREFDGFEEVKLPDDDVYGSKKCRCYCHYNATDEHGLKRIRHCYNCSLKVIDGELYYRINNKTLKKVTVIYHKQLQPSVPPESETPAEPIRFQDDETAEKENMNVTHPSPHKNKSPSRPRISLKLKIPKNRKGKGRFYTLTEVTEPSGQLSDSLTSTEDFLHKGSEEPQVSTTEHTSANHLELSAEELGIEVLKQDADTVVFQLKNCEGEQGVTNYQSLDIRHTVNQTSNIEFNPNFDQTFEEIGIKTIFGKALGGTPTLPNLCVVPPHSETVLNRGMSRENSETILNRGMSRENSETILNRGMSRENSEVHLDILIEDANTSPKKLISHEFLGENSNFGFIVHENSNSDILEKAFKSALMGHGDVSVDNYSLLQMLCSPVKTSSPGKAVGACEMKCRSGSPSPNKFFSVSSEIREPNENSGDRPNSFDEQNSPAKCIESLNTMENSQTYLNLSDVSSCEQNVSCHHQNLDENAFSSDNKLEKVTTVSLSQEEKSRDRSLESNVEDHNTSSKRRASISGDRTSSDLEIEGGMTPKDAWKRECDRALLEACKEYGSCPNTFQMISDKLGSKTPQQVADRFQTLMELLSETETPSEDEDSLENSK